MNFEEEFKNMPEEMQQAQTRLGNAVKRQFKAKKQSDLWYAELSVANNILKEEAFYYGQVSLRWNPETQTMNPPKEEMKVGMET